MEAVQSSVIDYGVDYITVTATRPPRTISLLSVAKENLQSEAAAGNEETEWRGLGYAGRSCGGASFGVGPQGVLARLSSGVARENWRDLYRWGSKCTRLDVQVTIRHADHATDVLRRNWQSILEGWKARTGGAEPQMRVGPRGPFLINVGSRQSHRFGRIYDKGVESKLDYYEDSVRWEVEYKGAASNALASKLIPNGVGLAEFGSQVEGFYQKHRATLKLAGCAPAHFSVPRKDSTRLSKLRYVNVCIRPLVLALACSGPPEEVFEALGLEGDIRFAKR